MDKWISVEDGLPDVGGKDYSTSDRVLCFQDKYGVEIGYYQKGSITYGLPSEFLDLESRHIDVTHWMPLPEPPNE